MPKMITLDKGSKRRLSQIRWKLFELMSLVVLAVFLFAVSILLMIWELQHEDRYSEPSKVPQIKSAEPAEP